MAKTTVVNVKGFGPVTVRGLTKPEYLAIQRKAGEHPAVRIGLMIQAGVIKPEFESLGVLEGNDEGIDLIANAIIDLTRANLL